MAESKKILSKDIVQEDIFKNLEKSAQESRAALDSLELGFKNIIKIQAKVLKETSLKTGKDIRDTTKAINESARAHEGLNKVKEAKIKLTEQEIARAQIERKDAKERVELLKAELILQDKSRGVLEKLNAANTKLRIERGKVNAATKEGVEQIKKLNKMIDLNNAQIIKNSDQLKKAKLNVGNYSASIRAALAETGVFDNGISRLVINLKNLVTNLQAGKEGASKMGLALKALSALGIVALLAGITSAIKANQGATDFLSRAWADLKDSFTFGATSFGDAERALQSLRIEMRKMKLELQLLMLDEEDFKEISNDTTLGFIERDAALNKSFELRKEIAAKNIEIAQKEFDLAQKNVASGAAIGIVSNEILDARNEAQLKLNKALDDQNDLERILGAEARKRRDTELIRDLELVRSKKKSSTAQLDILEEQLNNEKLQIEEREIALEKFNKANRATFDEQIRLIKTRLGVEFDAESLLSETNNIALAEKIKGLQLGEEVTSSLATIIKKSQDAEIKGLKESNKLEEEKVQRKLKIASIERDIARLKREDQANDLEFQRANEAAANERLLNDVSNDPFNRDKLNLLKEGLSGEGTSANDLAQLRARNLEAQRVADEKQAEATISDKQILAAELLKIQTQYDIDLGNLDQEAAAESQEIARKNAKILTDIEKQKTAAILNELSAVTNAVGDELDKRSQRQADAFDSEIELREKSITRQQELAAQGLDNQLAFEQAQQAKTELARKDALEKARKQKEAAILVEAYFNAFNARLSQEGSNPGTAAAQALGDVLLAKGIAKGVVQFLAEGTEDVKGPGNEKSDSVPAMLSVHEAVIPAKSNKKYKGVAKALIDDTFDQMYLPKVQFNEAARAIEKSSMERAAQALLIQNNQEVIGLLKKIEAKPVQMTDIQGLKEWVETIITGTKKTVIRHKMPRF